ALFVRPYDAAQAVWVGPRAGVDGAKADFGADMAYPIEELEQRLGGLLAGASTIWFSFGDDHPRVEGLVAKHLANRRAATQRGAGPVEAVRDPLPLVDELRVTKSATELRALQKAIDITGAGLKAAMAATRPGMHEYEAEAILEAEYRRLGSPRNGFPTIAAA